MPLYDYHCNTCRQDMKDHFKYMSEAHPECCGQVMQQLYNTKIEIWDSTMVFEHAAEKPMRFENKKDMKRFMKQTNQTSYLLDA